MSVIARENWIYLVLLSSFLGSCLILLGQIEQGDIIVFFAQSRHPFWDTFFIWATKLGEGFLYLGLLITGLFTAYRYALGTILTGITVVAVSTGLKAFFAHVRPYTYFTQVIHKPELLTFVEGVHLNKGWHNSFPSGHTTSAFALFGLWLLISNHHWQKMLFFLSAVLVGISRIYLVQHFLKDVFAGAILGTLIALFCYYWVSHFQKYPWAERNLGKSFAKTGDV
ncbi:MAG: phosphatase PAP2 family protein [Saprospiraceae bacterium]|nr:phosphatase PAP2 family protein [Saprospiraceae bacterium]